MWQSVKFTLANTWRAAKWLLLFYAGTQIVLAALTLVDLLIFKEATDAVTGKPTLLGLSLLGIISARLFLDVAKTIIDKLSDYSWALLDTKQVFYMNT